MSLANSFIKIEFKGEIRRLPYDPEEGIEGLKQLSAKTFKVKDISRFHFTYEDSIGDNIFLSDLEELSHQFPNTTAKIILRRNNSRNQEEQPETSIPEDFPATSDNANEEQEQAPQTEKKKKQKKKDVRASIKETKVVRLRWRNDNNNGDNEENKKKNKKKGPYLGVGNQGNLRFNCKKGRKGLWLRHELESGQFMFAPLSYPNRFLRMTKKGGVDLSKGGMGKRTRWSITADEENGTVSIASLFASLQLSVLKRKGGKGKGGKARKAQKEGNRRNKNENKKKNGKGNKKQKRFVARGIDTSNPPENLIVKDFKMEEVNAEQVLIKLSQRKARREQQQQRKQRQEQRKVNPLWAGKRGLKKMCKQRRAAFAAVAATTPPSAPFLPPFFSGVGVRTPHPHPHPGFPHRHHHPHHHPFAHLC